MTPTARALIAAARAGLDPDPAAAARIRARLDARLAAPAAAGVSLKLLAMLGIVGGIATLGALSAPAVHASAPVAPSLVDTALVDNAPVETRVHIAAASAESPAPPARHRVVVAPVPEVSLAREVELIDRAMSSLRAGHAQDALASIALYHRETADRGQLLEDASAIDIEASCTLHLDVSTKLAAFDATWPSSAQRSRLTSACH